VNWIRIAVGIGRDPSVIALSRALGVSTPLTTGCCVLVFAEIPSVSRGGDLSGVSDDAIEAWAQWPGKRGKFAAAFRSHLCTDEGVVRSWEKHNGAAIRESDKAKDRMRMARERSRNTHERSPNVTGTVRRTFASDVTGRDETVLLTTTDSGTADAAPPLTLALAPVAPPKPPKKPAAFPHFPVPLCQQLHGLWVSTFGACDYPRFRKEFGPLFTLAEADRPAEAPTNAELAAALKSYADLAPLGLAARFANVSHAAGCLAAIARTRRELADDPSRRSDAVMRIIHGRAAA